MGRYKHTGYNCDVCRAHPIEGIRFRSVTDADWDCCESCCKSSDEVRVRALVGIESPIAHLRHCLLVASHWWVVLPTTAKLPDAARSANFATMSAVNVLTLAQQILGTE